MAFGDFNVSEYWDASANRPKLVSGRGINGKGYIVSTPGTTTLDGINSWAQNDIAIFILDRWIKFSNTGISSPAPSGNAVGNYVTSNFSPTLGSLNYCDTSGSTITAVLPTNPTAGAIVGFRDAVGNWATSNLIIDPSSLLIDGLSGLMPCDTSDANFDLVWRADTGSWSTQFIIAPMTHRPTVIRAGAVTWGATGGLSALGAALSSQGVASWGGSGAFAAVAGVAGFVDTWDPGNKSSFITLSGGNLVATLPSALTGGQDAANARALFPRDAGFYFEIVWGTIATGQPHGAAIGLVDSLHSMDIYLGGDSSHGVGMFNNSGYMQAPGQAGNFGQTWGVGDVMGLYIRTSTVDIYKNGTKQGTSFTGRPTGALYPAIGAANAGDSGTGRFSGAAIQFLPSGATPWNGS